MGEDDDWKTPAESAPSLDPSRDALTVQWDGQVLAKLGRTNLAQVVRYALVNISYLPTRLRGDADWVNRTAAHASKYLDTVSWRRFAVQRMLGSGEAWTANRLANGVILLGVLAAILDDFTQFSMNDGNR